MKERTESVFVPPPPPECKERRKNKNKAKSPETREHFHLTLKREKEDVAVAVRLSPLPARRSPNAAMGLLRGRRGISILAAAMLVTGTLNTIATKLQVR